MLPTLRPEELTVKDRKFIDHCHRVHNSIKAAKDTAYMESIIMSEILAIKNLYRSDVDYRLFKREMGIIYAEFSNKRSKLIFNKPPFVCVSRK